VAYERAFYEQMGRNASRAAREMLPIVFEYVQPRSVVDVGCGNGAWLAQCREHGAQEILGFDGPWIEPDLLRIPRERFRAVDLSQPLPVERQFDLVVSLEVAEHLPPESAEVFAQSLTTLGSTILFSAAIPYQGGTRHLNERWPSYWYPMFAARGFRAVDCLRSRLWPNTALEFWYSQNSYFLVRTSELTRWPALAEAARHLPAEPLDLVHPRMFLQSTAFAKPSAELFQGWLGSLRDRWITGRGRRSARERARAARWPVRAD
jgi:SAM-dependent methyltransferase